MVRVQDPTRIRFRRGMQQRRPWLRSQAGLNFRVMDRTQTRRSVWINHQIVPRKLMVAKTER